jgi:Niemann-Pick C1 protein
LPLILLGIGIDDAYVVTGAFDRETRVSPNEPAEARIYSAIHRAGMSITVTSMTDFCAFMLGSITRLPAIKYFCQDAAIAIIFIYFAHLTVFPALLALDDARQRAHRLDMAPCVVHKRTAREAKAKQDADDVTESTGADTTVSKHVSTSTNKGDDELRAQGKFPLFVCVQVFFFFFFTVCFIRCGSSLENSYFFCNYAQCLCNVNT